MYCQGSGTDYCRDLHGHRHRKTTLLQKVRRTAISDGCTALEGTNETVRHPDAQIENMNAATEKSAVESGPKKTRSTRRKVLKTAMSSAATLLVGGGIYLKTRPTVRLAIVGAGVRGSALVNIFNWMGRGWPVDVEVSFIVDPDLKKASALAANSTSKAKAAQDYREVLADKSVDAVVIATCDHWHAKIAIEAMRSGKAVYCEKPMSITWDEGQQIADVAAKTGSVFQLGSQQRHHHTFREFADLVLNDSLGEIELIEVLLERNKYDSTAKWSSGATPPNHLDWDLWVGPTPDREYCPAALHGWHEIFQFSGGSVLTWGAHHWDIANWILETLYGGNWFRSSEIIPQVTYPDTSEMFDVPLSYHVEFRMKNRPRVMIASAAKGESTGLRMTGTKGRAMVNRARVTGKPYEDLQQQPLPRSKRVLHSSSASHYGKVATALHLGDFLRCTLDGGTPLSSAASSSRSNELLQLTNIACRQAQPLRWNNQTRTFVDNDSATAMLKRPQREV